ncbi:MAG: hypothetical protein GYB65_02595 [Chloroflexi bacterium]|nr:hypothetical protein [Chloroflexota bacterium]
MNRRYGLAVMSAVVWTALVLGLYYWVHKPITPALAGALGGAVVDVALAALLVIVAGGLGRRVLCAMPHLSVQWSAPERLAAEALIGLGLLSLAIMLVGAVVLRGWSMIALLGLLALFTRRDLGGWFAELGRWLRGARLPQQGWVRLLALAALLMLAAALIMALLPPTKWDVLTYHLAGPEQYVARGHFYAVPHNHFLGFPQLVDTLYAGLLAISGRLTAGAPLHWLIGALLLMLTGGYAARQADADRQVSGAAGWIAVIALLAARTVWFELTFAYVDLMLMGLSMVGLLLIDGFAVPPDASDATPDDSEDHTPPESIPGWQTALALGLVLGFAGGTKYTAVWMGVAFGVLVLWVSRRDGLAAIFRRGAIIGVVAGILVLPWLARNAIWYDNPLFPFAFDGGGMDSIRQEWYSKPESGLIYGSNAWQIPIMPVVATVLGLENAGTYAADPGPLFLVLVPLVPLAWGRFTRRERTVVGRALLLVGVMTLCWMVTAAFGSYINLQTRLVLYMFPPLAVVAGIALEGLRRLPEKPLNIGFVIRAMVALVVVFMLMDGTRDFIRSGIHEYFSAREDYRDGYLRYTLGWHYAGIEEVNDLPRGSDVRFLWEPRTLYCDDDRVSCRPDSLLDSWYHARRTVGAGTPEEIAADWRAGADYFFVYEFGRKLERGDEDDDGTGFTGGNDLYTTADWAAWDTFAETYLIEVWRGSSEDDDSGDDDEDDNDVFFILYTWRE